MPVPSWVRPRAPSTRWKRSNRRGSLVGGDAGPGVADGAAPPNRRRRERETAIVALEGELEGVGEEVEDDLLPHVAVDVDRLGQRRAVHDQLQPRPLHGGAENGGQLGREGGQVGRLVGRLDAAGLDAREVEQRVDQLEQAQAVAVDDGQPLAVVGPAGRPASASTSSSGPSMQRQRRAELVADVAEEGRLGAVELGQRLGARALLLVGLGVGQGRGDLPGDEVEEGAVLVVEGPARTDAGDQKRRRPGAARRRDRQDQGVPAAGRARRRRAGGRIDRPGPPPGRPGRFQRHRPAAMPRMARPPGADATRLAPFPPARRGRRPDSSPAAHNRRAWPAASSSR